MSNVSIKTASAEFLRNGHEYSHHNGNIIPLTVIISVISDQISTKRFMNLCSISVGHVFIGLKTHRLSIKHKCFTYVT